MADSLFDNRYRYDYIYPRGRSGETLRAVDTQDADRLVVVKRPAPNDAPPIRAGQEVSILNERKALTRLAGHPVLTALVGGGPFVVGGMAHQYIVVERAQGTIVATLVSELAVREARLPDLEVLVIVDSLLDLLIAAHGKDIVYNDVDAKHLFWDRENYRLKVIDWGNAVFLEGDEITPQGISRQTDVLQVGELLFFLLTGGGRADIPRDAGEDFRLNFGRDSERISQRLQGIISKAAHPNAKLRYKTMAELRRALGEQREPLERERNAILGRVNDRLRHNRSKEELNGLLDALSPLLTADPGFPPARTAQAEVQARLRDLQIASDLDAVRIYLDSGSWLRAVDLLTEIRPQSRDTQRALIDILTGAAQLLNDANLRGVPRAVSEAFNLLFQNHNAKAAHVLITQQPSDVQARATQWLLAALIDAHSSDFTLLRPNMYLLETALVRLNKDGMSVTEPLSVLSEVTSALERLANATSLIELRDGYRYVVDGLDALSKLLNAINMRSHLPERKLPMSALERASYAAMALADNMHVIGRQAAASPRDAQAALDSSRAIDPTNPAWDSVARLLNSLYDLLGSYQTFIPAADGSDVQDWMHMARADLAPFQERLFDEMLTGMIAGLHSAEGGWETYAEKVLLGDRLGAILGLSEAIEAVNTISPTLTGWLNQLRSLVNNATYIERHALYGGLGRLLADGWEAFDRGRLADAERLGQQAVEIARSDSQRYAAERLRGLAEVSRNWLERNQVVSVQGTQTAVMQIEQLYTGEENATRQNFSAQMPSRETYLKAVSKGLVELYARSSTAAPRLLFTHDIILGALDAHDNMLDDAEFWREAALLSLPDAAERHPLTRALADFIERRRDLQTAAALLNSMNSPAALAMLESNRKKLEDNPQARLLIRAIYSLREIEGALRDWQDGEFRPAGLKLENALQAVGEAEQAAAFTLTTYRAWLMELQQGAADLHNQMRVLQAAIESRPDQPLESVLNAHRRLADVTTALLGEKYAPTLRGWRDTYEHFLTVYDDPRLRRSEKLSRFNQLMRAMFIDRHPAYPLYRHWYEFTEAAPEFPAPPTDQPMPQITEAVSARDFQADEIADEPPVSFRRTREMEAAPRSRRSIPWRWILVGMVLLGVVAGGLVLASALSQPTPPEIVVTISETPAPSETALAQPASATAQPVTATLGQPLETATVPESDLQTPTLRPTALPIVLPSVTPAPSLTPTPSETPTVTPTPTATETPSATPTPTLTFTPTASPTATLPPGGLQGDQDLLALADNLPTYPWSADSFDKVDALEGVYWRLGGGNVTQAGVTIISLPATILENLYGNNAATRVRRMEVEMALTSWDPNLVGEGNVYFGAVLSAADSPANAVGLQFTLVQAGVVNLGLRNGADVTTVSQRVISAPVARIRLERDVTTGAVQVYFNGEALGAPLQFVDAEAGVLPTLYVYQPNVVVSVTNWSISLK